jgi:thiamine biosynthesis lipoprotein ApbE
LCKKKFKKITKIIIDGRGDILIESKKKINIGIENPFDSSKIFKTLNIKKGAIATSSHNRQNFKYSSHIICKKTNIFQITLFSKKRKLYEIDFLATWFLTLSLENVLSKLLDYTDLDYYLVLKTGEVFKNV